MPTYGQFVQGIDEALTQVRTQCSGNALMVSSGGPISPALGRGLGTPAETTIELNYRLQATPFLSLMPNVQYVIRPNGLATIADALVLGLPWQRLGDAGIIRLI